MYFILKSEEDLGWKVAELKMVPARTFHRMTSVNIDPSSCDLSTLNQFMCEMHWLTVTVALHARDGT